MLATELAFMRSAFVAFTLIPFIAISAPLDTLPVVVHVIHTGTPIGSPDNPTDADIHAMIDLMNDAFQKNGPFYGGADLELAFALASRDPDCQSTTGIVRVDGSVVDNYEIGGITNDTIEFPNSAHEVFVKGLSRWPNTDYINIWVVHLIDSIPNGSEGYAYYPEYNSALTDGIVVKSNVINGTNKLIIHELGHYFYLAHTFGFAWFQCDDPETDCNVDGDWICDTEQCMFTFDCELEENPCTEAPWEIADAEFGYTVLNNYMGYTTCSWMFTEGQKDRMLDALMEFRPGLLSSQGNDSSVDGTPEESCTPDIVNGLSEYYGIERVEFGSLNVYSNSSEADALNYVDRTCNQVVRVTIGDTVAIRITASFYNPSKIRVYLDLDYDGVFDLPSELIFSENTGFAESEWIVPLSALHNCNPMRLRVVADHPFAPDPSPCLITGTAEDGAGQVEDYSVIVEPRLITSVSSGNWNNPAIWSCNCIPGAGDAVIIDAGDIITVPQNLGTVTCAEVYLEPTSQLVADGNVNVTGGCQ